MKAKAQHITKNKESHKPQIRIKICGMRQNTVAVASLMPDYLGFIFWEPSKRFYNALLPHLPHGPKKVGVFVDASLDHIKETTSRMELQLVQLHGNESAAFCKKLKEEIPHIQLIKVFSIKNSFNFKDLSAFDPVCDFYLFDTKGKLPGGNGYKFNWEALKDYPGNKPYFLSGGIGLEEIEALHAFFKLPEARFCHAIDVNSKFEVAPGLKDIEELRRFMQALPNTPVTGPRA